MNTRFYFLTVFVLTLFASSSSVLVQAEVKMGSHVLQQEGTDEYCYNDGPYYYEKVEEMPGVTKTDMFARLKPWIPSNLKVSNEDVTYDAANDLISINVFLTLADFNLYSTHHSVNFKMVLNFKDGKMRIKASDFQYNGMLSSMGIANQSPLHKLPRTLSKKDWRMIYEAADKSFSKLTSDIISAAKGANSDKW